MNRKYRIPVTWEVWALIDVEASSLEKALDIVRDDKCDPLPAKGDYIEDSFQIDYGGISCFNDTEETI